MQFIRNSLSFSFISNQGNSQQSPANGTPANGAGGGTDARKNGTPPSRSESNLSEKSQYATVRSKLPLNLGSPPSAYSTPFQSPVIASRTFPTLVDAAATLNRTDSRDDSGNGTIKPERSSKVYFIEQGQLQTDYELPERPGRSVRGTASVDGDGIVNPAFTNDSGATVINMPSTQPSVIREQYWTWSCRCRRELTSREKALLIVIFVLVLVIGGLATYLGIVVDSDDGITGGILTRSVLQPVISDQ
ncbi:uncharacterized protein LOC118509072 [Anopheles stephensi]|uniref:uncharacterized protein LOC118509072 n=1 Tax=Anopheles stephensi TaxID=30069 RepID=UPI0016587F15|nr:uncharacterized protein LOC118509072 [Anopheles stephensi]XP_035905089.1 uncharacterized protein LOC118509072 [Anopheles stephensi]XP_035905090.1 uncharacterized protein LOC118509072 [Anopheles stephensi]XP_035905091.1 uncharacterized protein LOC118509072 [Anopheles stephensi]XP_035905092.1 uncharacterized protein LOC118509072 [Anopheles stephensi]XP_035905093.1 uncharacterized protein LOC118509072 [Anopheles stephensi]XP_035905094.1 uncharacterized protein LOC118509072 [Anopheles stephens